MIRSLAAALLVVPMLAPAALAATQQQRTVTIGYVATQASEAPAAYAGITPPDWGSPLAGLQLGIADGEATANFTGLHFAMASAVSDAANPVEALAGQIAQWSRERDVRFVVANLPAPKLVALADAVHGLPVLLMNAGASDDVLRGASCRANIVHLIPSTSMLTDALVQYLVARNWTRIAVLAGADDSDRDMVAALTRSAARFGANLQEPRPFVAGNDPRQRDLNNPALLTADIDADVLFVADAQGEFARALPYATAHPIPVVGSAGLVADAWHWSWDLFGAPQVQHRFEAKTQSRKLNAGAWAAWVAAKVIGQAIQRAPGGSFDEARKLLTGGALSLDGVKGYAMSFRRWDGQMRQPILLHTPDQVIAEAPLPQFLHQSDTLDTLGVDAPESQCKM